MALKSKPKDIVLRYHGYYCEATTNQIKETKPTPLEFKSFSTEFGNKFTTVFERGDYGESGDQTTFKSVF